ncbi:hypothetical protein A9Z05_11880 [Burkholderia sp. A2]|nr:hypothetical protein A9Z05_11880 [Burkholderia sp. A2]OXI37682.1 hypothetical protein CFB49_32045 [Burkholderia sp. AU17457]
MPDLTTTLPAASRRDRPPTAVSPRLLHGSVSPARFRLRCDHRARRAARRRAAPPHAVVLAHASASRFAARCGDARPSIPHRSSVVHSKP